MCISLCMSVRALFNRCGKRIIPGIAWRRNIFYCRMTAPRPSTGPGRQGKNIVAVGTTSVRVLESQFQNGQVRAGEGYCGLFIYPGYQFKVVDRLLTNFHLPKSTLLLLVSAFAGRDLVLQAYREAIAERYRFYSYGDCMLVL